MSKLLRLIPTAAAELALIAAIAASSGCATTNTPAGKMSASEAAVEKITPVKDQRALTALKQMSDALSSAKSMSFDSETATPIRGPNGQWIHVIKTAHVEFRRPDGLRIETGGDAFLQRILFDGKNYTVISKETKLYSQTAMPGTVENMLGQASKVGGDVFAFSDVLVGDPYASWTDGLEGAVYVGESDRRHEKLSHLALTAKDVDWEVWIGEKDHLPHMVYVKYTDVPHSPAVMIEFSKWKLNASMSNQEFAFKPTANLHKAAFKAPELTAAPAAPTASSGKTTQ